jgi:integrase
MKLNSYLKLNRHGIYCLRIQRNGSDRSISLRTKDFSIASAYAYEFGSIIRRMKNPISTFDLKYDGKNIELKTENNDADRAAGQSALLAILQSNSPPHQSAAPLHVLSHLKKIALIDAIAEYEPVLMMTETDVKKKAPWIDLEKKKADKTLKGEKKVLGFFLESLGADFDVALINENLVTNDYIEPRLSVPVVRSTVKRELTAIRSFVKWCCLPNQNYCARPLDIEFKAGNVSYEAFDLSELNKIFRNLPDHASEPFKFWIPIIGLYTGARIGEISGIKVAGVYRETDLDVYHLPGTKTETSPRSLPIPKEILDLGFLEYVKVRRDAGHVMLFDIPRSRHNGWGAKPSKFFTKLKHDLKIESETKVFHSFRHTIVKHMECLGISNDPACAYTGHSPGGGTKRKVYGSTLPPRILNDLVVSKFNWRYVMDFELNLPALKTTADKLLEIQIIKESVKKDLALNQKSKTKTKR